MITDPSGAVIPRAEMNIRSTASKTSLASISAADGSYALSLPTGRYEVNVSLSGFEPYTTVLEVGSEAIRLDIQLAIKQHSDSTSVFVESPSIDTTTAQVGNTIQSKQISAIPLNGRSFTDLLAIQPGVVPASSAQPNAVVMSGCTNTPPSGDLNPGNMSVSGQRETANGFAVNGSAVEEDFNNGTAVVPNLDSIQELNVLTSNFNAEYGNYSGGQVMVTTKSGTNQLHGSGFEFLRNTALDSRGYFAPERARYDRNQYGGTVGGPIRKDKVFFFFDYQGTKMTQGQETGNIIVPSAADREGKVGDLANQLTGTVSTGYWANQLSTKLGGQNVWEGEPYYISGCTDTAHCVFPNAVIPRSIWSAPSIALLPYIPSANGGTNVFSSSSQNEILSDNKAGARIDINTRYGNLSGYYFIDQYTLDNPYPTGQGGANVPGFNAVSNGRAQLFSLSMTRGFGATMVNEAHFSYMRYYNIIGQPVGGLGASLASQGFVECSGGDASCLGIVPLNPKTLGIENVAFRDFTIGVDTTGERQVNNTFQWSDNFSKVIGRHTLKLGGSFHVDQVNIISNSINNGSFVFQGTETGSDFADFLLGVASSYEQGNAAPFYIRNHYLSAFGQDTWQVRPNIALTYGLRWDVLPPWHEKYNQLQTFVLGQQSVVYPNAPRGIVFPGDPGVPSTLAPTQWHNFSPRLGMAYSPNFNGLLGKLFGAPGKSSIHAGFGMFFSAFEGLSAGIMSACAPYGYDYDSTVGLPSFAEPFRSATSAVINSQPFPSPIPAFGASPSNPNTTVDWSKYSPITGDPAFYYRNRSPYTESYNISWEREVARETFLKLAYVGSQSHRLLVLTSANPGNAALCLQTSGCGPFNEVGVRTPFDASFDAITYQKTIGFSNYNALEASLRHTGKAFDVMAAYTYGKSLDNSSSLSEPVYPDTLYPASLSKAISAFDLRHNFVLTYRYNLPFERLTGINNRWTSGWSISGVTRFSTGLPVTLYNNSDSSLLGTFPNGINNNTVDTPYYTGDALQLNRNPRSNLYAFNSSTFTVPEEGTLGNVPRRFFYGPGMDNFDASLQKETKLRESAALLFRMEAFNVLNHAQFFGAASVNGDVNSQGFGQIVNGMAPRQVQLALKLIF